MNVIGYAVVDKRHGTPMRTGGAYSGQTSKLYTTEGKAKAVLTSAIKHAARRNLPSADALAAFKVVVPVYADLPTDDRGQ